MATIHQFEIAKPAFVKITKSKLGTSCKFKVDTKKTDLKMLHFNTDLASYIC